MSVDKHVGIQQQLRAAGFRVTSARIALLSLLTHEAKPLDVPTIRRRLATTTDQATIYRTLQRLVESGLVRRLSIRPGIAHYESATLPHHHHLICEQCGFVEDVTSCCDDPQPTVASFSAVKHHTLEYSGICNDCAA